MATQSGHPAAAGEPAGQAHPGGRFRGGCIIRVDVMAGELAFEKI